MNLLDQTREAVGGARRFAYDLLNVTQIPDEHPILQKVNQAFVSLEEALEDVPLASVNGTAMYDTGPVVYPVPKRDAREWPTSSGRPAREEILDHLPRKSRASKINRLGISVTLPEDFTSRRALTSREYIEALERAHPAPSPVTETLTEGSFTYCSAF